MNQDGCHFTPQSGLLTNYLGRPEFKINKFAIHQGGKDFQQLFLQVAQIHRVVQITKILGYLPLLFSLATQAGVEGGCPHGR